MSQSTATSSTASATSPSSSRTPPSSSPPRARARLASVPEDSLAFALALGQGSTHRSPGSPSQRRSHSFSEAPIVQSPSRPIMITAHTSGRAASSSPLRPSVSDKGKERAWSAVEGGSNPPALVSQTSSSTIRQLPTSVRTQRMSPQKTAPPRPDWVVDLDQVAIGSMRWKAGREAVSSSGRVVLVMGEPSPATLERTLAEALFSDALIIVSTEQPASAPASPPSRPRKFSMPRPPSSYSLSSDAKRPPSLKSTSRPGSSYGMPALSEDGELSSAPRVEYITSRAGRPAKEVLDEAAQIARRWRHASQAKSNPPSRHATPPTSRRSSGYEGATARPRPMSVASFTSMARSTSDNHRNGHVDPASSPFDVLLHFVPSGDKFQPLLQQAVMVTTAALPFMDRQLRDSMGTGASDARLSGSGQTDPAVLLHILPPHCPQPLPRVMDSFLASMVPASHPTLKAFVLAEELLDAPLRIGRGGHTGFSAMDVVVSGGLLSGTTSSGGARSRSYLGSFSECRFLGLSLEPPTASSHGMSRASSSASLDETAPEVATRRPSGADRGYESSQLATAVWTASQNIPGADVDAGDLVPPRLSWSEGAESTSSSASLPTTPDLDSHEGAVAESDIPEHDRHAVEKQSKSTKKGWFGRTFGRKTVQT